MRSEIRSALVGSRSDATQAAARRQERIRRNQDRVAKAVETAGVRLTDEQHQELVEAFVAFEGRRNEIWGEMKADAAQRGREVNWATVVADTTLVIQREFAQRISGFIHETDADLISAALKLIPK